MVKYCNYFLQMDETWTGSHMAIDLSGQERLLESGFITIEIKKSHPLIQLANVLPWMLLIEIVVKDLQCTTEKGFWWMGRKIKVRMHLAAYLLQRIFNLTKLPWNIRRAFDQIKSDAWRYLLDVGHFTRTNTIKAGKILSFHAKELACIKKGKLGKEFEFGRVFQLGRIKGNFIFVLESKTVGMNDKANFIPLIEEHVNLFGSGVLKTVAADKGYWSMKNRKELITRGIFPGGLQKPSTVRVQDADLNVQEHLRNRRAGIEPLIGHIKHGGQLGRSRMKSDRATLAAGYGSVLALNLRQLIRHQQGKMERVG